MSKDGNKYILVVIDVFTGFIMLRAMPDKGAETAARNLWEIFCTIGVPKILQSDQGKEFINQILHAMTRLIGVEQRFITPYNPRADGKVERSIRTVIDTIHKLMRGASIYWPTFLPFVQLAYNNKVQELTRSTPFSLMFGRILNEMKDYTGVQITPISSDDLLAWKEHFDKVHALIYPAINTRMKQQQYLEVILMTIYFSSWYLNF